MAYQIIAKYVQKNPSKKQITKRNKNLNNYEKYRFKKC